ncbi:tetratricopeptide repeat protein [Puniceicoccaceae bacterium K14]|nr:tetratricopeptide repeat protein [Puniceicoccaceae bacterium K14]
MKINHISKSVLSIVAAGAIGVSALVAESPLEPAGNVADQLEEAIFLQEAESNLEEAIKKYQAILEAESLVRTIAAEAQYRLAECYWEQGNKSQAFLEFGKLEGLYPEEERWVLAAKERLPEVFEPAFDPFVEGERFKYKYTLPTGKPAGYSVSTLSLVERDGQSLWHLEHRVLAGEQRIATIEFDTESFDTVYCGLVSENLGVINTDFSNGGKLATVEYPEVDEIKELFFQGKTYENDHAQSLVRQFPVEIGYSTEMNLFVHYTTMQISVTFEIVDILEMDTVLGVVECYHVEANVGNMKQSIFITTNDRRIPVLMKVGGISVELMKSDIFDEDKVRTYTSDKYDYSFDYSDNLTLVERGAGKSETLERINFLAPTFPTRLEAQANLNEELGLIVPGDFEATIKALSEREMKKWKDFDFGDEPYQLRKVNGMDAAFFDATRESEGEIVEKFSACFILSDTMHYSLTLKGEPRDWSESHSEFLNIAESISE